ncbi:hypothetical protein CBP51_10970 [Cellvibrio mixtus]|uniref:Uncharacterized protein n=1 Tax=Cellvibrio mixtus TaxID=39650 RepID=A0A266QCV3_9GAMM|nr:hypothetical protein CBP51_10970 [Cellvibrio mixtus]
MMLKLNHFTLTIIHAITRLFYIITAKLVIIVRGAGATLVAVAPMVTTVVITVLLVILRVIPALVPVIAGKIIVR